ncbi:MAG: response regulator [Gammaproteobacteria bacterium]|nr:response regulator [Gammaproteobacteria bacterium]
MVAKQQIFRVRRNYNQWVANQTLEDYALRFTAKGARRWSAGRVATTALGAISFLALEAIGAAITLHHGFDNALFAVLLVSALIFLTALPISYYAARYGVDIDLLTRGAGFGYIGSTISSLIYASFTFIFFALEAAIMAMALELIIGLPLAWGYLISSLVVIPLVTFGITLISRFQLWSQPLWLLLQLLPFGYILYANASAVSDWASYAGAERGNEGLSLLAIGSASAVLFSLIAQIGEQVDLLRFMPPPEQQRRWRWWAALLAGGPGWILIGAVKILAGSFLLVLALNHGLDLDQASDPTQMYRIAFGYVSSNPDVVLALTGIFVVLSQLKINVTNAYAGSIAWSNFFSRLTHSHPGRVVWLVFNVAIALLLMELGIYRALEQTLGFYAVVAVAWVGALVADLVINKPLGLSPAHIEFKRAHLFDINPVGVGAMLVASVLGILCHSGQLGELAQALSHFITLGAALLLAPAIAWATKGRYYLARPNQIPVFQPGQAPAMVTCCICEHHFEQEDVTHCPAYAGQICSLCCSLDARCQDYCKPGANYASQLAAFFRKVLPVWITSNISARLGHFLVLVTALNGLSALLLALIYHQSVHHAGASAGLLAATLWQVFFLLLIVTGVICWLFVLAHESRLVAQEESQRQTRLLLEEIEAHERTDKALQQAKEHAEAANLAKSRYLTGISHELRSPLNAVLGYAQLLERDRDIPPQRRQALGVIRQSGEHLADLIEGLLDISKIEAGRLDLHQQQVQIRLLLEQLAHMFRLQAQAKGLRFHFEYLGHFPLLVKTDEKRLRQILINLLSNAVKYTREGQIRFTASYRNQVAEFTVSDSGEGIAADDLERIFRPFERLRQPGSTATGTGLGLTITRLLCEIMGGDIAVSSTPGKGSTFKAMLMLSRVDDLHLQQAVPAAAAQIIDGYHGPRRQLLVVDDDDSHRRLMRELLGPLGFELLDFANPLEALALLQHWQGEGRLPDLVMLDVAMPGMDGWQLARHIRSLAPSLPLVMVSADASDGVVQGAVADSAETTLHQAYLFKPVHVGQLLEQIGALLELQWCYRHQSDSAGEIPAVSPVSAVSAQLLAELAHLARIGHRKGLQLKLTELQQQETHDSQWLQQLQALTSSFQFERLLQLLDEQAA